MVRPHLEYAVAVWDPHQQGKYKQTDSPTEMMENRQWHGLHERRFVARQSILYKSVRVKIAVQIPEYFVKPTVETRGAHVYTYTNIRPYSDCYKYSFFPCSIRCWNLLPSNIITSPTVETFKNTLWRDIKEGKIIVATPRDRDRPIQLS